jgi:hypothetical protein
MRLPKPKITREEVMKDLVSQGIKDLSLPYVVGYRGYYKNTMGKPCVNDRGIFDDIFVVISPLSFEVFNGNTDPSVFRKGIATLRPGVYDCVKWKHKQRVWGLQIILDVVSRDGFGNELFKGRHAINFHDDLEDRSAWSEGCQTLPKSQLPKFTKAVYSLMETFGLKTIKYVLIEK